MVKKVLDQSITRKWYFFTMVYLFIEYARPQDIFHLAFLRPGLLATVILTYYLFKNGIYLSNSKQTKMIWYFIIWMAMHIPFAVNNFWAYQTTVNMLQFVPFILSVIICIDSIERLKIIINTMVGLMIYISIYSFLHGGMGSGAFFHDENDVSLFINMLLPFCFFLFLHEKEFKKKLFYATGVIVGVSAVVVSFSRGGFVGLVSAGFFIWLFSNRKILSLVILLFVGLAVFYYSGDSYVNEMGTVTDQDEGTAQARLQSWGAGWRMFLDNPLGVGGNNFQWRFPEYQGEWFQRVMGGRVAHSLWFTLIPELGIVGVFIFFRLLIFNLKDLFYIKGQKVDNNPDLQYLHVLSLSFISGLAGFFASATFISVLYYPHYWYLTGLIVATRLVYAKSASQEINKENTNVINKYTVAK